MQSNLERQRNTSVVFFNSKRKHLYAWLGPHKLAENGVTMSSLISLIWPTYRLTTISLFRWMWCAKRRNSFLGSQLFNLNASTVSPWSWPTKLPCISGLLDLGLYLITFSTTTANCWLAYLHSASLVAGFVRMNWSAQIITLVLILLLRISEIVVSSHYVEWPPFSGSCISHHKPAKLSIFFFFLRHESCYVQRFIRRRFVVKT